MPSTVSDGIRIAYDDEGSGEPALLLLPGWAVDRTLFAEVIRRTSGRRRTLALDWRGHGESDPPRGDFGNQALLRDAAAVIDAAHVRQVVPVSQAHAGWIAVELLRTLPNRIPGSVFLSWMVLDPPPPFVELLTLMTESTTTLAAREQLFSIWLQGVEDQRIHRFVRTGMGRYEPEMFQRAAREILSAYRRESNPLAAIERMGTDKPIMHLYAQPPQPEYLAAQRAFSETHRWFEVERLEATSHFLPLEVPEILADRIERLLARADRAPAAV